ncbi:uncharacterized protein DFL_004462 [Arthrobotrys flagrans]|uniref:Uncharacterized protein n=1 Tax=Arthrobotrys flagrans TaxID=97331 RepID=A0A437A4Q1_ARTFL|nr:hypothetical protein DFL_004462 [Arthrobotrys flagrans]
MVTSTRRKIYGIRTNHEAAGPPREAESIVATEETEIAPSPNTNVRESDPNVSEIASGADDHLGEESISKVEELAHCSYCLEQLCPPTCATALFLDYRTGIFLPASLYPIHDATAVLTKGFPETTRLDTHFRGRRENSGRFYGPDYDNFPDPQTKSRQEPGYKTIW